MDDKRFWGGAILAVTVIIGGASALPALLLQSAATDSLPVAIAATAKIAEPVPARPEVPPARLVAQADPLPTTQSAPAALVPQPAVPAPEPTPPPQPKAAAAAPAFPPVQAVDIPAHDGAPIVPVPANARVANAAPAAKPARVERAAAQRETKRKRARVRPAIYPLREFFAWRR